jgi:hypothetical protein
MYLLITNKEDYSNDNIIIYL